MGKNKIVAYIEYQSVLEGYENLEERNAAFHELIDEGKRLEIAWDALNLVLSGKMWPHSAGFWGYELTHLPSDDPKEFQKALVTYLPKCEVCQRGLIMVSTIRLGNRLNSLDYSRLSIKAGTKETIQGFNMESLHRMEQEYEREYYGHPFRRHTREKLANICCNILVNGDFNIKDKKNYLEPQK